MINEIYKCLIINESIEEIILSIVLIIPLLYYTYNVFMFLFFNKPFTSRIILRNVPYSTIRNYFILSILVLQSFLFTTMLILLIYECL
jgi:hypothetical protein